MLHILLCWNLLYENPRDCITMRYGGINMDAVILSCLDNFRKYDR
jgi:hypothetical protein